MSEFNADLVDGTTESHAVLATSIAKFVDVDLSEPQLPGNRDAWRSDYELRELEKPAGYDKGNWGWYADVCLRAIALVQSPSGKALLVLSRLNGERRIHEQNWILVGELADEARGLIALLDDGARKDRLASLLDYHLGIVARYVGDYDRAVLEQINAAEKAEAAGDYVGAAIARLCEMVERYSSALSNGTDTDGLLRPLHEAALYVVATCAGNDPVQIGWRLCNAPVHILEAHIWGVHKIYPHEERFWLNLLTEELPIADRNTYEVHLPLIVAIQAGLAFLKNERAEALRLANSAETMFRERTQPQPGALVTARFVLAMIAADDHLTVIVEEGDYMHQLRNMARRILGGTRRM